MNHGTTLAMKKKHNYDSCGSSYHRVINSDLRPEPLQRLGKTVRGPEKLRKLLGRNIAIAPDFLMQALF